MITFTPNQIQELLSIIDLHVIKFVSGNVGKNYITSEDKRILKSHGISLPKGGKMSMSEAYKFGILSQALSTKKLNKMSYADFKKKLKNKTFLPLDLKEVAALRQLEFQAYNEIRGLGNKMKSGVGRVLVEADKRQRAEYEDLILTTGRKAIMDRKGVAFIRSELGHATKDWARDFDRIADTMLHDAHEAGRAAGLKRRGGKDVLVYKKVYDLACKHCVRLYMDGEKPIIFKLSVLESNGTNIGRKVKDWKPVVGATHPWCRCNIMFVGPNMIWDDKGKKFVLKLRDKSAEEIYNRSKSIGAIIVTKS